MRTETVQEQTTGIPLKKTGHDLQLHNLLPTYWRIIQHALRPYGRLVTS